jgi:hypothetical protein
MKAKTTFCLALIGCISLLFALTSLRSTAADDPALPPVIQAIESPQFEALFAASAQQGDPSPDMNAAYTELKQLAKNFREANSLDARGRIQTRASELLGQIFDMKVQGEEKRIEKLQARLDVEKAKLGDMQRKKRDLVHEGVQKMMDTKGVELPAWAQPPVRR